MDVVTFGETMVLFTPGSPGPLRFSSNFQKSIGGAESNVAVALARLGHQASWVSRLGNDEFGLYIRNFLRGEGVDTSRVVFDDAYPTAVFFKETRPARESAVYYYRKGSAASQLCSQDIKEEWIAGAKYLHITGITPALSESCKEAMFYSIDLAKKHGVKIVFDPNIRLKLWSKEEARSILNDISERCDIVLPGLEEGEILTGQTDPARIAHFFLEKGVDLAVVKIGEKGAYFATHNEEGIVSGNKVDKVIDPIGAGDGFAAGFLSGLLRGWSIRSAVELGNQVGSYAVTVSGDVEGYPYWSQVVRDSTGMEKEILR
jgi:2-dehydro-3-deoxygluconokinase